ncbi:hypothetical protein [Lacipirellula limnantheis]|uniref:hypothetical protein n=1 Tax=Lacipirellula limnantheis TaxID=2528024 RepID=UPI00143D7027|nr:hypothetical protein [Lacipirellula limnantheis]
MKSFTAVLTLLVDLQAVFVLQPSSNDGPRRRRCLTTLKDFGCFGVDFIAS